MTAIPVEFGARLRRYRLAAGMSLADLAKAVHYTKGHLSRVESGHKKASPDLARLCDAVFGSDGVLSAMATATESKRRPDPERKAESGRAKADGVPVALRDETTGEPLWPQTSVRSGPPVATDADDLRAMRAIYDQLRGLGQRMSAATLMPTLAANTKLLLKLASRGASDTRESALALAARFAEYAGWMAQEDGDDTNAMWWTDRAVEFALAGGDLDLVSYGLVRKGLIALYQHDSLTTVDLSQRAQAESRSQRVLALAAQREAQGHAIGGNYSECQRALERATGHFHAADASEAGPVIGTTNVIDPVAMTAGWCMFDLGRPALAAIMLRQELDRIPPQALRARARYGARLALALANSGEIEEACAVVRPVLGTFTRVQSATVRADLRDLAKTVNRWYQHRDVAAIIPELKAALHVFTPA